MTPAPAGRASPNAHLLIGEMPAPAQLSARWREGTSLSIAVHAIALAVLGYGVAHAPQVLQTARDTLNVPAFVDRPGRGGGGGGGGTSAPDPARAEQIAETHPHDIAATTRPADSPQPDIVVPIVTPQAMQIVPGAMISVEVMSPGKGALDGSAGGRGPGSGPANGPGAGNGGPRGAGDGAFEPGSSVTTPDLIREVKPGYTVDAMRAKLQGVVVMEIVVLPDGSVDPESIRITRSLDGAMGLDGEAVRAVKQWRFRPGTHQGRPVPVRVIVELTFTLR